jgi:hypothetical protein
MTAAPTDTPRRRTWVGAALLCGAAYFLIGRLFALPHSHVQAWRLAAWGVSGVVFATQIVHEQFRLRSAPRSTALHAAIGVAIGAFWLAIAGMTNALRTTGTVRPSWFLALVLWPAFTAVPAFLAALVAAVVLARRSSSDRGVGLDDSMRQR